MTSSDQPAKKADTPRQSPPNYLKCRDDHQPVTFVRRGEADGEASTPFVLTDDAVCTWMKHGEAFGTEKLRPRIEPWLTALFQSEHLSLLLGSGLSSAVHRIATGKAPAPMSATDFGAERGVIDTETARSSSAAGRKAGNIEDQVRAASELLRGLEILGADEAVTKSRAEALRTKLTAVLASFAQSILDGENGLVTSDNNKREHAFNYLVSFLMSFASRAGTRDRLNIFTTNYDRFIEAGAEAAGLHLLDRFVGSLAPIFRSSRLDLDFHYNPPGIRGEPRYLEGVARFTKLHGSLDWVDCDRNIRRMGIPFGAKTIAPYLEAPGTKGADAMQLMIYPNAAKDRETASYPYVELFRDFASAACRPNHTLVTFGYSFGDDHINRVIEDMLTIPSTHLVVISFDDPLGRILSTYGKLGRHAQISLLVGDHVGEFRSLIDNYLPKPAIDRTTFRMAELLKARWGANKGDAPEAKTTPTPDREGEA